MGQDPRMSRGVGAGQTLGHRDEAESLPGMGRRMVEPEGPITKGYSSHQTSVCNRQLLEAWETLSRQKY